MQDFDPVLPPLQCSEEAAEAVRASLESSGLLLFGEVHGVRENPLLVRTLVRTFGIGTVALEWPPDLAPLVSQLVAGGSPGDVPLAGPALTSLGSGDGRVTAGHLAVLRELASEQVRLVLMDGVDVTARPPAGLSRAGADRWLWSHRDAAMAAAVLAASEPGSTSAPGVLVVAGNAHTELHDQPVGTPLGAVLAHRRPGVRSIRVRYGLGRFYNYGSHAFPRPDWASNERPILSLRDGQLELLVPRATEAVVLHLS